MTSDGREQPGVDEATLWRSQAEYWRAEAERLAAENSVLRAGVGELEAQVAALTEKVATLARLAFGKSSEKKAARRAPGPEGNEGAEGEGSGAGTGRRGRGQQRGSTGHGRRDYSHLPTREEIHDVPEGQRCCPRCGAGYAPFGQESCEQIDWQVHLTRIVHRRVTYRRTCGCPVRGVLVAPPVPKAITNADFRAVGSPTRKSALTAGRAAAAPAPLRPPSNAPRRTSRGGSGGGSGASSSASSRCVAPPLVFSTTCRSRLGAKPGGSTYTQPRAARGPRPKATCPARAFAAGSTEWPGAAPP